MGNMLAEELRRTIDTIEAEELQQIIKLIVSQQQTINLMTGRITALETDRKYAIKQAIQVESEEETI